MSTRERIALTLAQGAVALVLIVALGSFGRAFYLAVVPTKTIPSRIPPPNSSLHSVQPLLAERLDTLAEQLELINHRSNA